MTDITIKPDDLRTGMTVRLKDGRVAKLDDSVAAYLGYDMGSEDAKGVRDQWYAYLLDRIEPDEDDPEAEPFHEWTIGADEVVHFDDVVCAVPDPLTGDGGPFSYEPWQDAPDPEAVVAELPLEAVPEPEPEPVPEPEPEPVRTTTYDYVVLVKGNDLAGTVLRNEPLGDDDPTDARSQAAITAKLAGFDGITVHHDSEADDSDLAPHKAPFVCIIQHYRVEQETHADGTVHVHNEHIRDDPPLYFSCYKTPKVPDTGDFT